MFSCCCLCSFSPCCWICSVLFLCLSTYCAWHTARPWPLVPIHMVLVSVDCWMPALKVSASVTRVVCVLLILFLAAVWLVLGGQSAPSTQRILFDHQCAWNRSVCCFRHVLHGGTVWTVVWDDRRTRVLTMRDFLVDSQSLRHVQSTRDFHSHEDASISHGWLGHRLSDDCIRSLCLHVCALQQMSRIMIRMRCRGTTKFSNRSRNPHFFGVHL